VLIRKQTLEALKALEGSRWQEASGELHYQNKEMPNWITISAEADLRAAHRAFVEIFEPHFEKLGDMNVTVAYNTGPSSTGVQRAFFDTNEEINSALSNPDFGTV
jgi:hypothetical protein